MQKKMVMFVLLINILPAILLACGGGDTDGSSSPVRSTPTPGSFDSVTVNLKNWVVEPDKAMVKAGTVTFTATHYEDGHRDHDDEEGGTIHQLVVGPARGQCQHRRVDV